MAGLVIDKFSGTYEFLSNFHLCDISFEGLTYGSVEAAFQAAKIKMDTPSMTNELREPFVYMTPSKAKRAGRRCTLRPDWEEVKDGVMLDILRYKFTQHPDLAAKLLATGDAELIEGTTWHDNYWGNCTCEKCIGKSGKNQLGKLLMQVREEIKR